MSDTKGPVLGFFHAMTRNAVSLDAVLKQFNEARRPLKMHLDTGDLLVADAFDDEAPVAQLAGESFYEAAWGALAGRGAPYEIRIHRRYNPEGLSRYNIVPGLIGTILTMTMVMLTGLAMTRERERGTMENLLATPVRP
mgnify:CR=1 FL=1